MDSREQLDGDVISCTRCPRLVEYREKIAREKKRAYLEQTYWGRPAPDFGDPHARLLIVGLAPAAHGANRTGRMFTGDRSGQWLYRALHRAGFANQSTYESADDGLVLQNAIVTATAHCAPPDNKPLPSELENCREYLVRTFDLMKPRVVLALGGIAWTATFQELKRQARHHAKKPDFRHAVETRLDDGTTILGSYHPSQQNTFTGRLTEEMFDQVFTRARELCAT